MRNTLCCEHSCRFNLKHRITGESRNGPLQLPGSCDTISEGYQCQPEISRYWGQYSPYFRVPSEISPEIPPGCQVTFAQVLLRHGGRDPTLGKSVLYAETIEKIKGSVQNFSGDFRFLTNYTYTLGADQLTTFGEQQMVFSGMDFFDQYANLAASSVPFFRASGQQRVIESAQAFSRGFHQSKVAAGNAKDVQYPYKISVISEDPGSNNTLDHGLCTAFEASNDNSGAQSKFASTFIPALKARLSNKLVGANLTDQDALFLMDLCPFETIANPLGKPSKFCALFTSDEWRQYDYYQTLGKYYGYGRGSPLGPTQGVGFVNELIARLTREPVDDRTSSNSTLDGDPVTFPIGRSLYADFGHDNDMTAVYAALGLYNNTPPLSISSIMTTEEMRGYSAARTVPFAARMFVEKLQCDRVEEETLRVLVNGRVLPLETCGGDALGRCPLSKFVESLSFARGGGHWDQCFATENVRVQNSGQVSNSEAHTDTS